MGFKFSMEKLLSMRIDEEEKAKFNFKEANVKKEKAQNKVEDLKLNLKNEKKNSPVESVIERKIRAQYRNFLMSSIEEEEENLRKSIVEVEKRRKEVKEKGVERKVVETLKEKRYNEYIKEQDYIEQKNNDEFALYGFQRKLTEGK